MDLTRCIYLLPSSILMVTFCLVLFLDGYFLYSACTVLGFGWLLLDFRSYLTVNKCYELLQSLFKNYQSTQVNFSQMC